jgi:hypothetical protein
VIVMVGQRAAAAIGVLALLAGCSDTPAGGPAPTSSGPGIEETDEPSPEPTEPESPRPTRRQPSIELAQAPIGGQGEGGTGALQCTSVSLTGVQVPSGTTIRFGTPRLEPRGAFRLDQSACRGQGRSCAGYRIRNDDGQCFVGVRQVTKRSGRHVTLIISAVATCATEQDCRSLEGHGGSQIGFDSRDLGPPESPQAPSTEPSRSESPDTTPSDG